MTDFPIALWMTSFLFDVLNWLRPRDLYRTIALWLIGLGLLAAPVAIATAFYDFARLARDGVGTAFLSRHVVHSTLAYATTFVYLASFVLRWRAPDARTWIAVAALAGPVLVVLTGYWGNQIRQVM
ncbi:MAG: DUF2231 domain-containing protein [Armatimonadota bacterium]|nr:DUF2231 domain-containing protein [Armatimonadota bacterium]